MTPLTAADRADLRAKLKAATTRPWHANQGYGAVHASHGGGPCVDEDGTPQDEVCQLVGREKDSEAIVAVMNDANRLLAESATLAQVREMREQLEQAHKILRQDGRVSSAVTVLALLAILADPTEPLAVEKAER